MDKATHRHRRQLLRLALRIHRAYEENEPRPQSPVPDMVQRAFSVSSLWDRIVRCGTAGFRLAGSRLRGELRAAVQSLEPAVAEAVKQLGEEEPSPSYASVRDIFKDLEQVEREFGDLKVDRDGDISVITDDITLDEIFLGDFSIKLRIKHLHTGGPDKFLYIDALDPHPASGDRDIVHPHVNGGFMCMGDGLEPIAVAATEGRLYDVFQIAHAVLHTYSPGSAFRELGEWDGKDEDDEDSDNYWTCSDCDYSEDSDDHYPCGRCGSTLCDSCTTSCKACESYFCDRHVSSCPGCEESFCSSCMDDCDKCARSFCDDCAPSLSSGGVYRRICEECEAKNNEQDRDLQFEPCPGVSSIYTPLLILGGMYIFPEDFRGESVGPSVILSPVFDDAGDYCGVEEVAAASGVSRAALGEAP